MKVAHHMRSNSTSAGYPRAYLAKRASMPFATTGDGRPTQARGGAVLRGSTQLHILRQVRKPPVVRLQHNRPERAVPRTAVGVVTLHAIAGRGLELQVIQRVSLPAPAEREQCNLLNIEERLANGPLSMLRDDSNLGALTLCTLRTERRC